MRGLPPPLEQAGQGALPPLLVHAPPLGKMQMGTRLGGNFTLASSSRSEAIFLTRGGCGDHFWLYYTSVRGQAADIQTPRNTRAPIITRARVENRPGRYNQDTNMADRYEWIYNKKSCLLIPSPLSNKKRRVPHLHTQREETLPMGSEGEQTVVKTCRPNSKRTQLANMYC
jgi:hypothetical protein